MIENRGKWNEYLLKFHSGEITEGLGIGCFMDEHIRYKPKQVCIILGHDNVGKSFWINWYMLTLALKYELKIAIWSGENQYGQILRDLIQMYTGHKFKELPPEKILQFSAYLEQFFYFIDNEKMYKPKELFELFAQTDADICIIDPYTGLDREMSYEGNYRFMNDCRQFVNVTGKTLYINTHPTSESGRSSNIYPKGHRFEGHLKAPNKNDIEGGKSFLNRCDDMFVIHRMIKEKTMKYVTEIHVEKIKNTDTGGMHTPIEEPVFCDFNYGIGFKINGIDPLDSYRCKNIYDISKLKLNVIDNDDLPF